MWKVPWKLSMRNNELQGACALHYNHLRKGSKTNPLCFKWTSQSIWKTIGRVYEDVIFFSINVYLWRFMAYAYACDQRQINLFLRGSIFLIVIELTIVCHRWRFLLVECNGITKNTLIQRVSIFKLLFTRAHIQK